ncbi:MAG: type II toxin-antitoxin system HicB family antitoxin [Bauldia sp.]|nr:type II toxin-antitoxin system HicB family antitoxin [Bauldia sp.]
MARYIALIDHADGLYGVAFPDAPGCVAQAPTQEDAITAAADALAEWVADEAVEGRGAPAPRSVEDLLDEAEIRDALAAGAVLASIPLVRETGRLARANISLDAGLLADIDETARRAGVTRSAFLAAAAREKIKTSP